MRVLQRSVNTPTVEPGASARVAAALVIRVGARIDNLLAAGDIERVVLGFSGGLDSTVLLHMLRAYLVPRNVLLQTCHVDHGLQVDSPRWFVHCAQVAAELGVAFCGTRLSGTPPSGASVEDWARQHRYAYLLTQLDSRSVLMTAHHRDDQAETVLLQLLRGAGPHGLAAIREHGHYADKRLMRPLLDEAREDLLAYGHAHALAWLEDPSNADLRFARNRVRNVVMPVLEREFPGAGAALARVAALQSEVVEVLDALADEFLLDCEPLDLTRLRACGTPLRPFVIKRWLSRAGGPVPGRTQLQHMLHNMLDARDDGMPMVAWRGVAVRRYDNKFFLTAARLPAPGTEPVPCAIPWTPLCLAHGRMQACQSAIGGAEPAALAQGELSVRYRQGGERLRLHPGGPRRALKHLFQEWRVPPWLRDGWPLVYVGDQLAVVPGQTVAAEFRAAGAAPGIAFDWYPRTAPGSD